MRNSDEMTIGKTHHTLLNLLLRIEYTSCLDKRIRHTKDVSVTLKQIEKAEVAKTKTDKQKTDVEEVRDPNANYYMCIGRFNHMIWSISNSGLYQLKSIKFNLDRNNCNFQLLSVLEFYQIMQCCQNFRHLTNLLLHMCLE